MNQSKWDFMSNAEKHAHLCRHGIGTEKMAGVDAGSKVNDDSPAPYYYRAECNDIIVSNWCSTEQGAIDEGIEFIESLATT